MSKTAVWILGVLILLSSLSWNVSIEVVKADATVLLVPGDYATIQAAINAANSGDTVFVESGMYYEHVVINKTLSVFGQDKSSTIIDGNRMGIVVNVAASNVNFSGFTVRHSGQSSWNNSGIYLGFRSADSRVSNNVVTENYHGVFIDSSTGNLVSSNNVSVNTGRGVNLESSFGNIISANSISQNSQDDGIDLSDSSNNVIRANTISGSGYAGVYLLKSFNNTIIENTIADNSEFGVYLDASSNNVFYRNNLVNNNHALNQTGQVSNIWDNEAEGNYWSDYGGVDLNGDGVGDTLIPYLEADLFPLMEFWSIFRTYLIDGSLVTILSNSTIASFRLNQTGEKITFNATGAPGTLGFCNVTIPKTLLTALHPKIWLVTLDGTYLSFTSVSNSTHASLFFAYASSTHNVEVKIIELSNIPPTADFTYSPGAPTPLDTISFVDASADSDGTLYSWYWDFGDGSYSTDRNAGHKYDSGGVYIVTLKVTDDRSAETVTSKAVSVRKVRTALATTAPLAVDQGELFQIVANLTDENHGPVQNAVVQVYLLQDEWVTIGSPKTGSNGIASVSYEPLLVAGNYLFRCWFQGDSVLAESSSTVLVEVREVPDAEPPVADAGANRTVYVDQLVYFDASGSVDNVGIVQYNWGFGDGAHGTGVSANHTYVEPGEYTVTLTVTDLAGNVDEDSVTLTVLAPSSFNWWVVGIAVTAVVGVAFLAVLWRRRRRRRRK